MAAEGRRALAILGSWQNLPCHDPKKAQRGEKNAQLAWQDGCHKPPIRQRRRGRRRYSEAAHRARRRRTEPKLAAITCWKSVPMTTGNITSPGKYSAAMTAPAEMLRMPTR